MEPRILPLPRLTQRLELRGPSLENAEAVQEAIEETFEALHLWMLWAATPQSLEDTQAFLERAQAMYESMEDFVVQAFHRDSGKFVLSTGLHPRGWAVPKFEIGYWCRTSMQGQGYVTEAVAELVSAAFKDMSAERLEIRADARNQKSRRVAELAGFRLEAVLRNDDRANDGSLRDTVIYAMFTEDFYQE